ncbi:hypothetical protein Dimus_027308 [Dionaea muscipula]
MTVIHLKKKDVVKTSVKGISIEFDHEQCVAILDVHWKKLEFVNTSRRYGKSRGTQNPLRSPRRFANDATIMKAGRVRSVEMKPSRKDHELPLWRLAHFGFEAFGVPLVIKKGEEPKKYDFFEDTFLTMCKLIGEDGIWWIGSGENRRRDDDEATQEEEARRGRRASDRNTSSTSSPSFIFDSAKDREHSGVDPSGLTGRDAELLKFQAEFERKRANKFHDELEKAKAENAKLLALLHKTQTKPHP